MGYLRRDLEAIRKIEDHYPGFPEAVLPKRKLERLHVLRLLYAQQMEMFQNNTHRVDDRIVSLSQPWVRPIVRGKQNADVEFGAKVEMSVVDGYLRVEDMRWDAFNEGTTLQASTESYRAAYGHYPKRILADTIFRTRENLQYCKTHGIHLNGPKLGKPPADPGAIAPQDFAAYSFARLVQLTLLTDYIQHKAEYLKSYLALYKVAKRSAPLHLDDICPQRLLSSENGHSFLLLLQWARFLFPFG